MRSLDARTHSTSTGESRLRGHAIGLLTLFGIQFIAGMGLNLFIALPQHHPGATTGDYFPRSEASLVWAMTGGGGWTLVVHTVIAVILVAATLALFMRSLRRSGRGWRWASGISALFTLGALFNGLSFLDFNEDVSSMIMASCWLVAVVPLVFLLARARTSTEGPKPAQAARTRGNRTARSNKND